MPPSTSKEEVLANIKRTTQATLDALNAWDHDALVAVRAPDFVFQALPSPMGLPPMNNAQYREMWFGMMTPALADFKVSRVVASPRGS